MIASIKKPNRSGHLGQVNGRLRTIFEKGTNSIIACDRGRAWPSRSRTQSAALGRAKRKPEDAEMRSRHVRHPALRDRGVGHHVSDAPVSKFTLSLLGGNNGLLENSENLCSKAHRAGAKFTGQNGKVESIGPPMANSCGSTANRKRKAPRAHSTRRAGR